MKNHVLLTVAFILAVLSRSVYAIDEGWLPHALEAYDLDSLRVCAIVLDEDVPYAVIKDPNGYTHRLFKSDRMGKNYGLTKEINSREIKLEEVYKDDKGEWVSKDISLKIKKDNKGCSVRMPRIDR